jgi:hypothetical protein
MLTLRAYSGIHHSYPLTRACTCTDQPPTLTVCPRAAEPRRRTAKHTNESRSLYSTSYSPTSPPTRLFNLTCYSQTSAHRNTCACSLHIHRSLHSTLARTHTSTRTHTHDRPPGLLAPWAAANRKRTTAISTIARPIITTRTRARTELVGDVSFSCRLFHVLLFVNVFCDVMSICARSVVPSTRVLLLKNLPHTHTYIALLSTL